MEFLVADVVNTLAAVSAIVGAGSLVVSGKHESYIVDPRTGERIMLQREAHAWWRSTMEVGVESMNVMGGGG